MDFYAYARQLYARRRQSFYTVTAKLVNSSPQEIAYLENATRAWDMVFYALQFKQGDRILTVKAEYASNYIAFLQIAKKTGAIIEVIPDDPSGQLSMSALESMIDSQVKLIAITHVPTQGGLINPAESVGKLAKAAGIFYLLDATQSVGQMPINVEELCCDAFRFETWERNYSNMIGLKTAEEVEQFCQEITRITSF